MKQFIIHPITRKKVTSYKLSLVNKGKLLFELPRLFGRAADAERMCKAINPAFGVKRA